jgi:predicted nucleotide-binding protein (sugar kinase/HSP70/actin superfamily)
MLTIGMPRALVHYDCSDVWVKFFESLGAAVAVSPETTKDIVDIGVSLSVEDACLPVKVYVGHAAYMAKRCDYLFVPRLVSLEPRTYMCPKFLGLPDMVRAALRDSVRLIDPTIDLSRSARAMAQAVARAASCLSKDPARSMPVWRSCLRSDAVCGTEAAGRGEAAGGGEAVGRAAALFADKDDCRRSADCDKTAGCEVGTARENGIRLRIGLLSHPYIISDRVLSMGLVDRLREMGVSAILPESVQPDAAEPHLSELGRHIFWTHEKRIYGAGTAMASEPSIAGIIIVQAFGCGPGSMIYDLFTRKCRRRSAVPVLNLSIDEHTGEAGIVTRLEAFVDMLARAERGCM